jgi:RNA polymerase sigma factor (sigma-70 family)
MEESRRDLEGIRAWLYDRASWLFPALCLSQTDADDVVQETLLRFLKSSVSKRDGIGESEAAWLRKTLTSVAVDFHRRRHRSKRDQVRDEPLTLERLEWAFASVEDTPSTEASRSEEADRIRVAVQTLPAAQRDAVRFFYLEGLTTAAAADLLACSESNVRALCKRGRKALAERLRSLGPE